MTETTGVIYAQENELDVDEFRRVLNESGLGATRPVDDPERLRLMLSEADLIMTARLELPGRPLVGVGRCITDFTWCAYLSELAVSASAQRLGIGQGLLEEIRRRLGPRVSLILISMPDATGFYEHSRMERVADSFWYRREV